MKNTISNEYRKLVVTGDDIGPGQDLTFILSRELLPATLLEEGVIWGRRSKLRALLALRGREFCFGLISVVALTAFGVGMGALPVYASMDMGSATKACGNPSAGVDVRTCLYAAEVPAGVDGKVHVHWFWVTREASQPTKICNPRAVVSLSDPDGNEITDVKSVENNAVFKASFDSGRVADDCTVEKSLEIHNFPAIHANFHPNTKICAQWFDGNQEEGDNACIALKLGDQFS